MLTFSVTPSLQLGPSEKADNAKLNQMARPTIEALGQASAGQLADKSIDATKTVPGPHWYALAAGFADNTYVVDFNPAVTGLVDGLEIAFSADAACSAAPLLNLNSLGAKALFKLYDAPLEPGDILTGQIVTVRYNSTLAGWQVTTPLASARRTGLANQFEGLRFSWLTNTTAKLQAMPGGLTAYLNDASFNMLPLSVTNATTSMVDSFTLTTTTVGLNGRDSVSAISGWAYVYLVSDGTQAGVMMSASSVKPSAAGGFTPLYWCRISAVYNTGGTALRKFHQVGRIIAVEPMLLTPTALVKTVTAYTDTDSYSEAGANAAVFGTFCPVYITKRWRGMVGVSTDTSTTEVDRIALAAYSDGAGEQVLMGYRLTGTADFPTHFRCFAGNFELPLITVGFFYKCDNAGIGTFNVVGTAFEI